MTTHKLPIRIYYEDTDAGSVVYHASYLRFAERARSEMLRDMGYDHARLLREKAIGFVVRNLEIDYLRPAVLDDLLEVRSSVTRIGGASFDLQQTVFRGEEMIADLKVVLVCMDTKTFSAARLPEDMRSLFNKNLSEEGDTVYV
ncbi:MAG: tol-pal system-associated acyl-CoA thioesterase [Pseudomonadota bacterium]